MIKQYFQPLLSIKSALFLPLTFLIITPQKAQAKQFEQCVVQFKEQAESEGFSSLITEQVIGDLEPVTRVLTLDKRQPEFKQSFSQYVKLRVTDYHVRVGKEKLKKHKALLNKLHKNYGIPPQYLVSFWGLETNFGRNKGKMSVLNSLATLACDQRRSEFFTKELFTLFSMIENNSVSVDQLQGSWAGAMGHMQFMPSALFQYGIDGDNNGKIDVWQSEIDALTSAANYLQQIGWQSQQRWGRQVIIPEGFDFSAVEFDKAYPLSRLSELGVTKISGDKLPKYDVQTELVLPQGHTGPAFLVYPNFNVIMKWNLSKNYALSVGLLANKLQGAKGVIYPKNHQDVLYSTAKLQKLQQQLNDSGFDVGKPDGIWGPNTRKAIRSYQLEHQLVADGFPNPQVFQQAKIL